MRNKYPCDIYTSCHECLLAGCSPAKAKRKEKDKNTGKDKEVYYMQKCGTPRQQGSPRLNRMYETASYQFLFENAQVCKDIYDKNGGNPICHEATADGFTNYTYD